MKKIDDFIYEKLMKWLYAAAYALCFFSDLRFIIKWMSYGETEDVIMLPDTCDRMAQKRTCGARFHTSPFHTRLFCVNVGRNSQHNGRLHI